MRNLRKAKALVVPAVILLIVAGFIPGGGGLAFAQATTGVIKGTVSDQTNAVLPGASVTAKNEATGVTSPTFKTTSDGIYLIPNLIPGMYTLSVSTSGFKTAVFTSVDVKLGQDTIIDVSLQPGGATESVTVTATNTEAPIEKDTAQVSTNFEARQIADLPGNVAGAGLDTIALLVPGVSMSFGNVNSNGTTLSVNGARSRSNNFTIDGQDNNDNSIGGPSFFVNNADSVAEYQVITNNFSAEYGRNQGAIVNIVTKSGTNQFHGSGFMFYRDSDLTDSLDNIQKGQEDLTAPPLVLYKVFGGTIGGPIIKDKLFFFGSYQGIRTSQVFTAISGVTQAPVFDILPSQFAALEKAFPGSGVVNAIVNDSAFALSNPGNQFNAATPVPGTTVPISIGGQTFLAAEAERSFQSPLATPSTQNEFLTRIDFKISDKDNLYGRYEYQKANVENGVGQLNGFTGNIPSRTQNASGDYTRQLSSRSLNDLSFNYTRLFVDFGGGCTGPGCIQSPNQLNQAFTNIAFGAGTGVDDIGLDSIGPATNLPQGRTVQVYQIKDNYSFVRGAHQFKTGVDFRHQVNSDAFLPDLNGAFTFTSDAQIAANDPREATVGEGEDVLNFTENDLYAYFQDDWKIRDNLTLNLGIRYEFEGQPENVLHDQSVARESDPATAFWLQSLPLADRTVPKVSTPDKNFAPRVGFAYTPRFWKGVFGDDKTVIRGGYSIAYDPAFYNILVNTFESAPFTFINTTLNPAPGTGGNVLGVPVNATGPNVRALAQQGGFIAFNKFNPAFTGETGVDPNFKDPYAEQWSLGVQRQFGRNHVIELRYLGTHGVRLFQNQVLNPDAGQLVNGFQSGGFTFPGFPNLAPSGLHTLTAGVAPCTNNPSEGPDGDLTCNGRLFPALFTEIRGNDAESTYNSLQARYNGRITNQLTVGASYTFSKALDNASEIFAFQEHSISQDPFNITGANHSYSGFDRPNQISMNFIWDLPLYRSQEGIVGHALGGWQLNGIYVIDNGLRFTPEQTLNNDLGIFQSYEDPFLGDDFQPFNGNPKANPMMVGITGGDLALLGEPGANKLQRFGIYSLNAINLSPANNPNYQLVGFNGVRYIENLPTAAILFQSPFGNVARNSGEGPWVNQANLGIFKNNRISERVNLQLRLEIFNVFNHPNPGFGYIAAGLTAIPDRFIDDAGTTFNNTSDEEMTARAMQIGVRVIF
jgi:hypothetical protein